MGTVVALWRYPVKSMQGQREESLALGAGGVAGDRAFGVLDLTTGTVISAKRDGRLLSATARFAGDEVEIGLADATYRPGPALDGALSTWLERPCRLVAAAAHGPARYEIPVDFEEKTPGVDSWEGPAGSFVDESPLHLLTTAALTRVAAERPDLDWSVRRFRPNLLLDLGAADPGDEQLVGRRLRIGGAELQVTKGCRRCVLTTRPQPAGIGRALDVLRHLHAAHENVLGVRAAVLVPGSVRAGDPVRLLGE